MDEVVFDVNVLSPLMMDLILETIEKMIAFSCGN